MTPVAGTRLSSRYELDDLLASGGMAQVWRAVDVVLDRPVAVKILHGHLGTDHGFVTRFRREAIAAARLSHHSIVSIYDTVSEEGLEAIVMELVAGRTLRARLDEDGPLTVANAVDVGIQVADALAAAHRGGIVHRDIKPSNILICDDGRVMVTDFGIAKAGEDTDLTVTGTLLGTAKYLAPEQVRGDAVDPRTDLYALGVVLYEAVTGRPPFAAETDAATALARLHQDPPDVRTVDGGIPDAFAAVVHRLLQRDPEDRYDDALAVRASLSGVPIGLDAAPVDATTLDATTIERSRVDPSSPRALAADDEPAPEGNVDAPVDFVRSERSWIVPAVLLCMAGLALALVGALFSRSPLAERVLDAPSQFGRSDTTPEASETTVLTPIEEIIAPNVVGARAFDPLGDRRERDDAVDRVFDGGDSAWSTERYRRAGFAGLKSGVGVIVDLGGRARVDQVEIRTSTRGWSVELYVADDFGDDPASWVEPSLRATGLDGSQTFDLDEPVGRSLLVWITEPGLTGDGEPGDDVDDDDDGPRAEYRFELVELLVS